MKQQRTVLCMKWGQLYDATYVNVLYSAVKHNLTGPFRFVCLTNEPEGLAEGIEHFPIPEIGLEERHWYHGVWPKLSIFKRDLYGLTGRCLFIDLDMMICASLDPFFDVTEPFVSTDMGPNWQPVHGTGPKETGTSIFAFDFGAEAHLLERFVADRDAEIARHRIEQAYIHTNTPDMAYWPPGWVISFKRHLRRPIGLNLLMEPKRPGPEVKVLAFHGKPRPADLIAKGMWGVAPHVGRGPVSWMAEYWAENGGG